MTMFHFKTCTAVTMIGLLAACGGGGGGSAGGGGGPRTVFTYQTFDSVVPGDSAVNAVGLTHSDPSGLPDGATTVEGDLDRTTRALTINGVSVEFNEINGSWTDGTTTVSPSSLPVFANTATYDFFVPVTIEEGEFESTYIVGIASRTEDLQTYPDVGDTAFTYTGVAFVSGLLGSDGATAGTAFESAGDLTLSADFATGLVGVVIDSLDDGGIPFDTVRIADMAIGAGDTATFVLSGTGITFENKGNIFTPSLGASSTESAQGAFFGGDAQGPVEAGGAFSVNGENDNTIFGVFAADNRP